MGCQVDRLKPIIGFREETGISVLKRDYVSRCLSDVMYQRLYERIELPVIESISSYSEAIVGLSPWPEWNKQCIFTFDIDNFANNYCDSDKQKVCLIPEGTVSITRWIARQIQEGFQPHRKLFYYLNCYRNEIIATLSESKRREFQQFGVEIIDNASIESDAEILDIVISLLTKLRVDPSSIRIRINNIAIFNHLCDLCSIPECERINLKELLDNIAECFAGKHPEQLDDSIGELRLHLDHYSLNENHRILWELLLDNRRTEFDDIVHRFPDSFMNDFIKLKKLKDCFANSEAEIQIDLTVIRSHQYYTGFAFEVDVVTKDNRFIEIAGGGRYDRLVGRFLEGDDNNNKSVPCTGFAFGVERVIDMLNKLCLLKGSTTLISPFCFD